MQIPADIIERMLTTLQSSDCFPDAPAMTRSMQTVWNILDDCLHALRLPLYHQRLGKKPAKAADHQAAIQRSLALLGAFAAAIGTKQAIVSTENGTVRSISFQPRPYAMNWTAAYAIDPVELTRSTPREPYSVEIEDMLHLAAKIAHAVSGHNIGQMPDGVTTFGFFDGVLGLQRASAEVIVRPLCGPAKYAAWLQ
jgi:hypothetical protein